MLISNIGEDRTVNLRGTDGLTVYLIDEEHFTEPTAPDPHRLFMKKNQTVLLK